MMIDRLRRVASPRAVQIGLLVVLVVTAVFLADAEGGEQIAEDAAVQRAAESVVSALTVTESAAREAVLVTRAQEQGLSNAEEIDHAVSIFEQRLGELDERVGLLAGLSGRDQTLLQSHAEVQRQGSALTVAIDAGDLDDANAANALLVEASDSLSDHATTIRAERQAHITAVREGISTVASAARLIAGLGIPALVILFLYRGLRIRQRHVLLRSELEREKALREKKDQFLAGASHHLNTPLSAVVGFAELLNDKSRSFNAAVRNEMIEQLANQANVAAHVSEDLLVAARSDMDELTLEETAVDIRDVVEEITRSWSGSELGKLEISGSGVARGDARRVTQIVRNLIRNASAYGGQDIKVTIREIFSKVIVSVADDGEGIPPGQDEKIFQPYYSVTQLDGVPPSLGIGLSVARRLARVMGGDLEYIRRDDESIFELELPRADEASSEAEPENLIIDPSAGKPSSTDITELLANGGPRIVYQPIIDMTVRGQNGGGVIGYESLARFPFGAPPEWFKAAKSTGQSLDLELTCIRAAIKQFEPELDAQLLAVNVSDETLTSSRLAEALEDVAPGRLVLELSETAIISNYRNTKGTVDLFQGRGIRLAIDDFGAEEIDLWHVIRLGASVVKVDMSLVRELERSPSSRGLIRAIVALAEEMGVLVIAEGVETETEHNQLLELGVTFGQGYLYGKPEPLQWSARVLSD